MCGALKLSVIVRADVRLNIAIPMLFLVPNQMYSETFLQAPQTRLFVRLFCAISSLEGPETPVNGVAWVARLELRPFHPPRGVLGPFGPKVGNGVENEFPGPSGPRAPKVKKRVEKESKKLEKS